VIINKAIAHKVIIKKEVEHKEIIETVAHKVMEVSNVSNNKFQPRQLVTF
jgi:hypothetical protein